MEVLGVYLGLMEPTRVFRFKDGNTGIVFLDRELHPECYNADGWPIDETGKKLSVYEKNYRVNGGPTWTNARVRDELP